MILHRCRHGLRLLFRKATGKKEGADVASGGDARIPKKLHHHPTHLTPPIDSFAFTLEQEEEGSKASVDF